MWYVTLKYGEKNKILIDFIIFMGIDGVSLENHKVNPPRIKQFYNEGM